MKYRGETKLSQGERTLEESESHLQAEQERKQTLEQRLTDTAKVLVSVRAGVEHLSIKLAPLKGTSYLPPTALWLILTQKQNFEKIESFKNMSSNALLFVLNVASFANF